MLNVNQLRIFSIIAEKFKQGMKKKEEKDSLAKKIARMPTVSGPKILRISGVAVIAIAMLYIAQLSIPFQKAYAAEEKTLADCAVKGYKLGFHIGVSDFRNGYTYLHSFRPFLEDSCFAFETTPYQTAPCYVLYGSYLEYIDGWKAAYLIFRIHKELIAHRRSLWVAVTVVVP